PLVSLYFGGMNRQEVAKELGCTPAALSVRVHRGRQMLGRRLTARGIVVGALGHVGGRGAGGHLMLGGLVAGGASDALRESMVARTADAVAQTLLGRNLASSVSSNVLSLVRLATVGGAAAPRAGGVEVVTAVQPGGAVPPNPARDVPPRRTATPAAVAPAPAPVEVARALPARRTGAPALHEPHGTGQFSRDPGGAM